MTRVATKPMDPAATKAANAAVSQSFLVIPSPGDADYPAFQKAWMDAYIANGGGYTEQPPEAEKKEVEAARAQNKGGGTTSSIVEECPEGGRNDRPGFTPPPTPCDCKITSLKVTCSHDRTAKSNLLQIVPKEVGKGDPLSISVGGSGNCASKLVTRIGNMDGPSERYGPKKFTANVNSPSSIQPGAWGWWNATPSRGSIEVSSCSGNPQIVDVERYPAGESKITVNFTKIIDGVTGGFSKLPVDLRLFTEKGTPRKIRRAGEAKSEDFTLDGLKKRFNNNADAGMPAEIVWNLASAWKEEEDGGHLVYCEVVSILAADPLFEAKFSILLYGIPIPNKIRKYINVAAGIYLNAEGKITLGGQIAGKRYPVPKDTWEWSDVKGNLSGSLKLELALELCVLSPKVLQAKGGGSVSASVTGSVRNDFGPEVWLEYQVQVGKLTAVVIFKTLWGLIEYEREWQIFEGWTDNDKFKALDFS